MSKENEILGISTEFVLVYNLGCWELEALMITLREVLK